MDKGLNAVSDTRNFSHMFSECPSQEMQGRVKKMGPGS